MSKPVRAIVGLGNPGPDYAQTRHNAGALWLEHLARKKGQFLRPDKKLHGDYCKISIAGEDIHLLFPTTFMNRSGQSVLSLSQFYKIELENILVAHDELDIDAGTLRLKFGGGHGGHNGLRDIIRCFGGNKDFPRMRLGIGHPGDKSKVTGHVLGRINKEDMDKLESAFYQLDTHLEAIVSGQWDTAMNRLHSFRA
ncbi:aminoacyl-tRNA hydrolase [Hahella sp. CR1]|uniref:aminoacyl-tRNA hydrolase n=1 Tax=Hahella sp. CR1 TaxID=2992807 RepID=UPI002441B214|nr:aminoacyl-tRNA hydrolase [Hahella sp. CR1]MDG9669567.1 aminoacyl-tRNA hydrolase [Hahella sp. CR1]